MQTTRYDLQHETDDDLLSRLRELIVTTNRTTADVLAHLSEIDSRKLYVPLGFSSLFTYATSLGLSESAAYKRIQGARLARRLPVIFEVVAKGEVHLSGLAVLAPHLTEANHAELLAAARHQSKRQIEELVAARFPQPDVRNSLRRLPMPAAKMTDAGRQTAADLPLWTPAASGGVSSAEPLCSLGSTPAPVHPRPSSPQPEAKPAPARVTPLSSERFKLQVTLSRRGRDLLLTAQALMRHRLPDGDLAEICEEALALLVERLERRKFAKVRRARTATKAVTTTAASSPEGVVEPSPERVQVADPPPAVAPGDQSQRHRTRAVAAEVKRVVAERDGQRCAFVGRDGHRCNEQGWVEYHHVEPFSRGGESGVGNLRLLCRRHHAHQTELDYGQELMAAYRRGRSDPGGVRETAVPYEVRVVTAERLGVSHKARRAVRGAAGRSSNQHSARAPHSASSPRAGLRRETGKA